MQSVSDKLASMENQLQYLTEVITQPAEQTEEAQPGIVSPEPSFEEDDREVKAEETDEEDAGQSESEEELESQTMETSLPPINTQKSNGK